MGFSTEIRRPALAFLTGILICLVGGCSGPQPVGTAVPNSLPAPASLQFDYLVGPGDVIRVNVAGRPDFSSPLYKQGVSGSPVDGSGAIQLPYLEEVPVAGKTVFEIRSELKERLLRFLKRPFVDVAVVEFGAKRIFVLGEVNRPGMFILDRPTTALEALSLTGGFTDDANREQIALVRGPVREENIVLFSAKELAGGGAFAVEPGDLIFVSQHKWAEASQVARDLVPVLQLISLPIGTARDVALFQDIRKN